METLRTGCSARFETVRGGLVPCKVLSVHWNGTVKFRVTRARAGYPAGFVTDSTTRHVIPTKAIRYGKYATFVRPYNVECDKE